VILWFDRKNTSTVVTKFKPLPQYNHEVHSQSSSAKARNVLYLAYGSNLCASVFQGNRGIEPLAAIIVVAPTLYPGTFLVSHIRSLAMRMLNIGRSWSRVRVLSKDLWTQFRMRKWPVQNRSGQRVSSVFLYDITPADESTRISIEYGVCVRSNRTLYHRVARHGLSTRNGGK